VSSGRRKPLTRRWSKRGLPQQPQVNHSIDAKSSNSLVHPVYLLSLKSLRSGLAGYVRAKKRMPFAIYAGITSTIEFLIGPVGFLGAGRMGLCIGLPA
jgi:hypothetical protein